MSCTCAKCAGGMRENPTTCIDHHHCPCSESKKPLHSPSKKSTLLDPSTSSVDGTQKVWICLYTCCVPRAVHLELVPDLSTPAFLRSLKCFTARRGLPSKIVSDNGKTFKASAKAIHTLVYHTDVQRYLAGLGVKWIFNVPKAW